MTTTASVSKTNVRVWLIGAVFAAILILFGCIIFAVNRYRPALSAYAWIQNGEDVTCAGSQATYLTRAFQARYGEDVKLSITSVEQEANQVRVLGNLQRAGSRRQSRYEAIFTLGDDEIGFLGLMRCVHHIEQLRPNPLPYFFWGG